MSPLDRLVARAADWDGQGPKPPPPHLLQRAQLFIDRFPDPPPRAELAGDDICLYWGAPFNGAVVAVIVRAEGGVRVGRVSAAAFTEWSSVYRTSPPALARLKRELTAAGILKGAS